MIGFGNLPGIISVYPITADMKFDGIAAVYCGTDDRCMPQSSVNMQDSHDLREDFLHQEHVEDHAGDDREQRIAFP